MVTKHLLTAFHCLVAAIVTPLGLHYAAGVADRQPTAAVLAALGAVVFPVLIATRVAWAAGYAAGRREGGVGARPEPGDAVAAGLYRRS
jgi:hypothetical protein